MGQTKPDPNALYNAVKARVTAIYADALKNSRGCEKKYFTFDLYYMWLQNKPGAKAKSEPLTMIFGASHKTHTNLKRLLKMFLLYHKRLQWCE